MLHMSVDYYGFPTVFIMKTVQFDEKIGNLLAESSIKRHIIPSCFVNIVTLGYFNSRTNPT